MVKALKKSKYISLKKASKLSGYSSDYLGQLIREGKLHGKQVYSNVAWVTTEKSVQEYLNNKKKPSDGLTLLKKRISFYRIFKTLKVLGIIIAIIIFLFIFYIASVSIDRKINKNALEKAQTENGI